MDYIDASTRDPVIGKASFYTTTISVMVNLKYLCGQPLKVHPSFISLFLDHDTLYLGKQYSIPLEYPMSWSTQSRKSPNSHTAVLLVAWSLSDQYLNGDVCSKSSSRCDARI